MRNLLKTLILAVMLLVAPAAFAQHGGHSSGRGSSGGSKGGQTHSSSQRGSGRAQGGNRTPHVDVRDGRFRGDIEQRSFGRDHRYYGRDFRWYGRPYGIGSRFFIGGFWFNVIEPWPVLWGPDCGYYIEYDGVYGGYFAYCPAYPGVRVGVSVVF